ncbi:MAG: molecular chaperone HtpG [Acidobacteriota bacterium]
MTTATEAEPQSNQAENFSFQAETRQLLDIVIHSLYSNKEIFLRELISNASDALDRLRFEALTEPSLRDGDDELEVRLEADGDARTLFISDNGIGMSREEVIANIGTIAKSGTRELMQKLKENPNPEATAELIGQFGVGFYSAFMVADRIELLTRRAGEETATRWTSVGDGSYQLEEAERAGRGTTIVLHLKPVDEENGLRDFTEFHVLQDIVKKHSDFVSYPVITKESREEPKKNEDGEEIEGETETIIEDKILNSREPIWLRSASDVSDEEYADFYRHISHDWGQPLERLALSAEGRLEYKALLFIPENAPFDLYYRDQQWGLRLYVRRVLIMERCENLLPPYLRFVRGVVDSADLPLNISREMVQHDRLLTQMRKWLTKKVLDHLAKLARDDEERYLKFFEPFGRVLKEGLAGGGDTENKDRLLPLLRLPSSADPEKLTSLEEYVGRMKENQDAIYYLTGESRAVVENSPHLEAFKDKGYEVLYLVDPVDEMWASSTFEFQEKPLKSVGKGTVELGSEEEKKQAEEELEEKKKTYSDLMERLQKSLDEHVKEVRLSTRLTSSPVCLVGSEFDMSPQLERLLRQSEGAGSMPAQKRIMELNPKHDLLSKLQTRFEADAEDALLDDYAHLLYGHALLAEGSELHDPARYNSLVAGLMASGI